MKNMAIFSAAVLVAAFVSGCAATGPSYNAGVYTNGMQEQNIQLGTVISARAVTGKGGSQIGTVVGGIAGVAVGSTLGEGQGRTLATVLGGLLGAAVGGHAQQRVTAQAAQQVTVKLDSGRVIGVVQNGQRIVVGERVQVVHTPPSGGIYGAGRNRATVRVMPL